MNGGTPNTPLITSICGHISCSELDLGLSMNCVGRINDDIMKTSIHAYMYTMTDWKKQTLWGGNFEFWLRCIICLKNSLVQNKVEIKASKTWPSLTSVLVRSSSYSCENNQWGTQHHWQAGDSPPAWRHCSRCRNSHTVISWWIKPWIKREEKWILPSVESSSKSSRTTSAIVGGKI